jgi:hypothetical protein
MKEFLSIVAIFIGVVVFIFGLSFIVTDGNLALFSYFAPKYAAVQRQVYVQTPSFILGNQADLEQQARAYRASTDPAQQAVIKAGLQTTVDNLGTGFPVPNDVKSILTQ